MRPNRRLSRLSDSLLSRIQRLDKIFATRPITDPAALDRITAYCTIELANGWAQFMRSYYLSCVSSARRRSGALVKHKGVFPTGHPDALLHAATLTGKKVRGKYPVRGEEPDWSQPGVIMSLAKKLSFSNVPEIGMAFGSSKSLSDLTICRNYFAHRGENTAAKIEDLSRRMSLPIERKAAGLINNVLPGTARTVFEDWSATISAVAYALSA